MMRWVKDGPISGWGCFLRYYREDWDGIPAGILYWDLGCP
jgi:hypothetical protein